MVYVTITITILWRQICTEGDDKYRQYTKYLWKGLLKYFVSASIKPGSHLRHNNMTGRSRKLKKYIVLMFYVSSVNNTSWRHSKNIITWTYRHKDKTDLFFMSLWLCGYVVMSLVWTRLNHTGFKSCCTNFWCISSMLTSTPMAVFSRQPLSRLIFLKVICLQTLLSDLKMIRGFTGKIKWGKSKCQYINLNNMAGDPNE